MTRKSLPTSGISESIEQQQLFAWAEWLIPRRPELALMYHIPNEGKRSKAAGGRMCAEGLKAGVPDICLPVPTGIYHGLYIEMKRAGGKATGAQKQWIQLLSEQGYRAEICQGFETAALVIMEYLGMKGEIHHVKCD